MHRLTPCLLLLLPMAARAQDRASAAESAAKGREVAASAAAVTIDWDTAKALQGRSKIRKTTSLADLVKQADAVKLPVLLPNTGAGLERTTLVNGGAWYAATVPTDSATYTIHGYATAVDLPALKAELGATAEGSVRVSYADGVTTMQFLRFGVSYELEVECKDMSKAGATRSTATRATAPADPLTAASPCLTEERAKSLPGTLEVVGGAP